MLTRKLSFGKTRSGLTVGDTVRVIGRTHTGTIGVVERHAAKRTAVRCPTLGRTTLFSPKSLEIVDDDEIDTDFDTNKERLQGKRQGERISIAAKENPCVEKSLFEIGKIFAKHGVDPCDDDVYDHMADTVFGGTLLGLAANLGE